MTLLFRMCSIYLCIASLFFQGIDESDVDLIWSVHVLLRPFIFLFLTMTRKIKKRQFHFKKKKTHFEQKAEKTVFLSKSLSGRDSERRSNTDVID